MVPDDLAGLRKLYLGFMTSRVNNGGTMRYKALFFSFFIFILSHADLSCAAQDARIELFSPQGTVKNIRQVSARFSEQMVHFGDPRRADVFEVDCSEKGHGRWADGKNWIYDFDRDLPAGIVCGFKLRPDLTTLSGKKITGQRQFSFSTGGPAIKESYPHEGSEYIDEDQIFVLTLDAEPAEESILSNVSFVIKGINERVAVRILKGAEREKILKVRRDRSDQDMPRLVLQCRQQFPNNTEVRLIWGKGIKSINGVQTGEDQVLPFKTRSPFTAKFACVRENPEAHCIPLLPMRLDFSASVSRKYADRVVLKGPANEIYRLSKPAEEDEFMRSLSFAGPFPENATFILEVPDDIKDDAGRSLENKDRFPLTVKTDAYPPLAKFSARFGIIEREGAPALPVTIRNLEPEVKSMMLSVLNSSDMPMPDSAGEKGAYVQGLKGRLHKTGTDGDERIIEWLKKVASAGRESSILKNEMDKNDFLVPNPLGSKAFEVVGIPLKGPGFYVVEMESEILGASLLGKQQPMYVPTAALVTNLSAHFKWGRESSLVWVTNLDKGRPVKDASVSIRDCKGRLVWSGKTDERGVAGINTQLPMEQDLPHCPFNINYQEASQGLSGIGRGLFVFAKTSDDMTFVHSSWEDGIEPWRFNLPAGSYQGPVIAHTIFDRSLLRAGETLNMKHILRKHTISGFASLKTVELPKAILVQHRGSEQRYEFPLKWDPAGIAETTWKVPPDARLGYYEVLLLKKAAERPRARTATGGYEEGDEEYFYPDGWTSGAFRVEEFRVPLMKGILQPPKAPLINPSEVDVDLLVTYLSGGGARNASVKLRSQLQPKYLHFDGYEEFVFSNGEVREGTIRRSGYEESEEQQRTKSHPKIQTSELKLDKAGAARARIKDLPAIGAPQDIFTELEFKDPNGEVQTVSAKFPVWPSGLLTGIKPDSWAASKESFKFSVVVLDLSGKPVPERPVKVDLYQRKYYSHRKRLIGGFYSYEHVTETKRNSTICEGKTDSGGLLICEVQSPVSGNVVLQVRAEDDSGNPSVAHRDVWVAGKGEWWFDVSDNDRIDLLPERKRYEPGETAKFQVRMPFREATALITVEREGIMESFIKELSGKDPSFEVPMKGTYAPNIFVSALVVRGRVAGIQPTALVDLGKPAYKLGISEINVGWKAHELQVNIASDKRVYKIREKAKVRIKVRKSYGEGLPQGSEVAIAVVDEGLLELMPNKSWKLLEAMMGKRGYEVQTSTAQMQVVGKRHYGLKALPEGGGGGKQITRELFDTLLFWKARVPLDENGEAAVEIPLGDSLTSFRIAVIASGGEGLFGTGEMSISSSQDLMVLPGIPQLIREGDVFKAGFTVRNASNRKMDVEVRARLKSNLKEEKELNVIHQSLLAGEAWEVGWDITAPAGIDSLTYEVSAKEQNGDAYDTIRVNQKVAEVLPVRTLQATSAQVGKSFSLEVGKPADAPLEKGGINVLLRPRLSNGLGGVSWYMQRYPYTCMEQKVSRAIALRDDSLWRNITAELPSHLDTDGLVKYFPALSSGSDMLTSYALSISNEAGWEIPKYIKEKMEAGLKGFIESRVIRYSSLPTADLSIRKMAALEALSRGGNTDPKLLGSIAIEPDLWPTSAVIDWMNVLMRMKDIPGRDRKLKEAEQILRARINFQGTTMNFSTEKTDRLWWLMVSGDLNAVKSILCLSHFDSWNEDMPKLVKGAISRQYRGAWDTTLANAWGVLAMEKFSEKFEKVAVTGVTTTSEKGTSRDIDWSQTPDGGGVMFHWSEGQEKVIVSHQGTGSPWVTIQSLAVIPLKVPFSSGYTMKKTIIPVEQKTEGRWSRGDVARVKLDLEAQADMTWVVVSDPVPSGAAILGTGLGRDSKLLAKAEKREGWIWPVFEERSFEAFMAYYEFVPKGKWTIEYTVRLNNEGIFNLPPTRVEALYAPEMMGEAPNETMEINP